MPLVTTIPRSLQNGDVLTQFTDSTSTSSVMYSFFTQQTSLVIENSGEHDIFVTVGSYTNQVIKADKKWKVETSFISFSIRSDVNSQEFIATAVYKEVQDFSAVNAKFDAVDAKLESTTTQLAEKASGGVFRFTEGTPGSTDGLEAINTKLGYKGNAIASGIRGSHVQQGSKGNENVIGSSDKTTIGTTTPNVVDDSKTWNAHYAEVGGYDNINNALAGLLHAFHCYIDEQATHGAIYGGSFHEITDGDYAAIMGGTKNIIEYLNGGSYSFVGAGSTNKIFARMSAILGGMNNRVGSQAANKEYSGIYHSYLSTIDGNYATVLGGNECKATKDYSLARGKGAVANNVGENVFSTGKFKTAGDSGQSTMHLFRQTTDGIMAQLTLDDANTTITALGINTSLTVKALISAIRVDTAGDSASFEVVAHIYRGASGTPILNAFSVTPIYKSNAGYNVDVITTASGYQVRCQGVIGQTINWTGKLENVWSRNV